MSEKQKHSIGLVLGFVAFFAVFIYSISSDNNKLSTDQNFGNFGKLVPQAKSR